MTEEIIIDGVNIAGCHNKTPYRNDYGDVQCKCYRFEDIENDTFLLGICKQHPHCDYKQRKRLEQEYFALTQESQQKSQTICELEQENKYYKQLLQGCPAEDEDCGFCEIDKRNKELEQENQELKKQLSSTKCYLCGEGFLTPEGAELYVENKELLEKFNEAQDDIESLTNANNYYFKENKELKEENSLLSYNLHIKEDEAGHYLNETSKYRSALEEINITVKQLLQGVSSNCINNTPYLTALSLIENKINEVLE